MIFRICPFISSFKISGTISKQLYCVLYHVRYFLLVNILTEITSTFEGETLSVTTLLLFCSMCNLFYRRFEYTLVLKVIPYKLLENFEVFFCFYKWFFVPCLLNLSVMWFLLYILYNYDLFVYLFYNTVISNSYIFNFVVSW